jgi:large subunit ribosomal protein L22
VRVTPRKVDQVLQLIRGKRVDLATEILDFSPKHVAKVIGKVMKSAVANAVAMEGKINVEHMRVKEAVAQAGPTMKRFLPRAQGRATPILKRTSHILIIVEGDAVDTPAPARRPRGGAPGSAGPKSKPVAAPEAKAAAPSKPARGASAGGRGAEAGKKKTSGSKSSKSRGSKSKGA